MAGILINMMMFNALGQRITDLNNSLSARIESIETRLNQVIGYLMEHRS